MSTYPDKSIHQLKQTIQTKNELSATELYRMFKGSITPEFNMMLRLAVQRQSIDPDTTLLQAIAHARSREYLIPIALCLRFGADCNMYVNVPRLGRVHLLGYTYYVLSQDEFGVADQTVLNAIVLMLVAKGSRPVLPMFEDDSVSCKSVVGWLQDHGYDTILNQVNTGDPSNLAQIIQPESMVLLSILLDKSSLMPREYHSRDMKLAIRAFSQRSIEQIPVPTTHELMDYQSIYQSVVYLNTDAFLYFIQQGQLPSYVLINQIITCMKSYLDADHGLIVQQLEQMLIESIRVGVPLDPDQMSLISTLNPSIVQAVRQEYEQPYWKKICRTPGEVPPRLRRLALNLNINPTQTKSSICDIIQKLSQADPATVKAAAKRRQQVRMSADLSAIDEFVGDKIPILPCRNQGVLPHSPFEYTDLDLAYYRDDQGAVWCFGSNTFEQLVESGKNPYNSAVLPLAFREELHYKIQRLKDLKVDGCNGFLSSRTPVSFSETLDSLSKPDTVSDTTCDGIIRTLAIDITLTKNQITQALQSIGYSIDVSKLSTSHAVSTLAQVAYYLRQNDPDRLPTLIDSIRNYRPL